MLYDYERMHILEKVRNMPGQVREMVLGAVLAVVAMMGLLVLVVRRARAAARVGMGMGVDVEARRWTEKVKGAEGEKNVVWALTGPPPPSPSMPGLVAARTW